MTDREKQFWLDDLAMKYLDALDRRDDAVLEWFRSFARFNRDVREMMRGVEVELNN